MEDKVLNQLLENFSAKVLGVGVMIPINEKDWIRVFVAEVHPSLTKPILLDFARVRIEQGEVVDIDFVGKHFRSPLCSVSSVGQLRQRDPAIFNDSSKIMTWLRDYSGVRQFNFMMVLYYATIIMNTLADNAKEVHEYLKSKDLEESISKSFWEEFNRRKEYDDFFQKQREAEKAEEERKRQEAEQKREQKRLEHERRKAEYQKQREAEIAKLQKEYEACEKARKAREARRNAILDARYKDGDRFGGQPIRYVSDSDIRACYKDYLATVRYERESAYEYCSMD